MEEKELRMVLDSHRRWLDGEIGGADLGGMKLVGLNLLGADLCGANLEGADLSNSILSNANMKGANLAGANLQRANLVQTLLYNAEFYGATLRTALIGVGLTGAKDILAIGPIGSRGDITYAVNHPGAIMIQCGCFWGPLEEWEAKCRSVYRTSGQPHGAVYEAAANFIRAYSLYWGREEAQEVDAAKRWAEHKVVWLTNKLAYTCQCSNDTSCGIPGPCPLNIEVNCLDVEPADWANLAGKRWEE